MDVGTTLRTARQRHGLSLPDLAGTTKIPIGILEALEDNAFDRVPRGIFIRGFLRAYAREVGLNPEELVDQFLRETADEEPIEPSDDPSREPEIPEVLPALRIRPETSGSGRASWGYALILAALLVGVISYNRGEVADGTAVFSTEPAADRAATAPAQPAVERTAVNDLQAVATGGTALRFEMQVGGPCWVEAIVDGRTVVYRLMQAGDRETIDAEREVVLRVGDPGVFTYSVNGTPGPPLGQPGVPVRTRFANDDAPRDLAS
jgi:cytoskeletal protein RodZ